MIEVIAETGSTNAELSGRLAAGDRVPEGHWLVADRQTAGRGRLGRSWDGDAGNFMGSTVVRVTSADPAPASLALLSGVAVHETAALFAPEGLMLKWPNDLLFRGGKAAGILLEMIHGVVVIGVGVNIRHAPEVAGRRTAALAEGGPAPTRDEFARALADSFERELQRWRHGGLAPLLRRWQSVAHPKGAALTVLPPGEGAVEGSFAGLSEDGNLLLQLDDGSIRVIHAGDVVLPNT
ncbi:biotin--[acetyl-CoA-carboxylase] ligase [Novosphingobium panipatense]|uniref:biotin--[biotin carboxyl-carrier protein] ligase n=2 Tax=Novosphingobium panipatense TaxID=428991 RepID=A0ABY1QPL4_9SPHN|nr:biotin--[acetyl-CoA-carboxylase] ligase [Novosphingobium panipatense]SMP74338.1 BirA family transcriptional regulator, biotin operon repressor / biotin-[acetyl-CoA-carboxylase] ligase [Novosphingobium panipatense]